MSSSIARSSAKKRVAPYGKWESPITSDLLVQQNISFAELRSFFPVAPSGSRNVLWTENRPQEKGRAALIHASIKDSKAGQSSAPSSKAVEQDLPHDEVDLSKGELNARSGVHEYGGGVIGVGSDGSIIFTDYNPQKWDVYKVEPGSKSAPVKVSPEQPAHRFADFEPHPKEPSLVLCVLEDHTNDTPSTVLNSLVLLDTKAKKVTPLVSGADFYSYPTFSADGSLLSWVQWNHPSMPWWDTEVRVAKFDLAKRTIVGDSVALPRAETPDGGEVQQQPRWVPSFGKSAQQTGSTTLYFTSDRTGFSNLYKTQMKTTSGGLTVSDASLVAHEVLDADMHQPAWTLGGSTYTFLSPDTIAVILTKGGSDTLALIDTRTKALLNLTFDFKFKTFRNLQATSSATVVAVVESDDNPGAIVQINLAEGVAQLAAASGVNTKAKIGNSKIHVIKRTSNLVKDGIVGREWLGPSEEIEFPTTLPNGKPSTAYAVIFPPHNPSFEAPKGTSPPCRIVVHGGPTSATQGGMDLQTAFWTSRGWMICAVNYGGSTGYGREYMNRMIGEWGVVDVEDCVAAAKYLGSADSGKDAAARKLQTGGQELYESPTAKKQATVFKQTSLPDGTQEITLLNHTPDWTLVDALIGAGLAGAQALSFLYPDVMPTSSIIAGASFWLLSKLSKVQAEVVKVVPGFGLQQTTVKGVRAPWNDRPGEHFRVSSRVVSTPRDRIVDFVVNEVIQGWGVQSYATVVTTSEKLRPLFPALKPRLPLVQRIYQSIHPALFPTEGSSTQKPKSKATTVPLADPNKIVISGGSSGGYTVLAALCLHPKVFSAACSRYGISELTALAADSHKFESKYPFRLLGGSPDEVPEIYHDRSPLYMADRIVAPVLIEQGDLDKVVPPNQSEGMVETIKRNGGADRVKYILFEGEGHGFRQAANKKRALEEELAWYAEVFKL